MQNFLDNFLAGLRKPFESPEQRAANKSDAVLSYAIATLIVVILQ